jgi:hypothetical protein
MYSLVLRAQLGDGPIRTSAGDPVTAEQLELSERLRVALADWSEFFQEVDGVLDTPDIADAFVSQAYKLATALRRELKGSDVWLWHPVAEELIEVELRRPR